MIVSVGSVCSGIEAASVAWEPLGLKFQWFSEIAPFPSRVLAERYPNIPNVGDMKGVSEMIRDQVIDPVDLVCGGTPCQAFSLAGKQDGLEDDRGNLTLRFADIVAENDTVRRSLGKERCKVFWENVEGVLTDKTNAFGHFLASLAGIQGTLSTQSGKWPSAGFLQGKIRNIAWRVLDAKYFGLPQQRRRLYLLAGGKEFHPEEILFEVHRNEFPKYPESPLKFEKDGHLFEVFRGYTDCLYSAYGTKWNGNAAAYNGSLFVVQDRRIRRLSPLETERLMGFPDDYTNLAGARKTNRYQCTGNSWAVPVVRWIGERLLGEKGKLLQSDQRKKALEDMAQPLCDSCVLYDLEQGIVELGDGIELNCTAIPEKCLFSSMRDIVSPDAPEDIYLSPVGCYGIVRRQRERNLKINPRLEEVLLSISAQMSLEEIEKKSRVQRRGRYSVPSCGLNTEC